MVDAPDAADFVLDASALAKLFMDEPESEAFRSWYAAQVHQRATFSAPSLLGYEIAQLLSRNVTSPDEDTRAAWFAERHEEVMTGIALDEKAAARTFVWSERLTAYDASYLAVASVARATLVTYDRALAKEANRRGVETVSP